MSQANDLAERVKALAKPFQAVIDLGAYLESIGSLEQATAEAQAAADKAQTDRTTALNDLARVQASVATVKEAITQAQTQAADIVAQAGTQAAGIIAAAERNADDATDAAASRLAALSDQTTAQQSALNDVTVQIGIARGELATITANIARVKGDLSKLLA